MKSRGTLVERARLSAIGLLVIALVSLAPTARGQGANLLPGDLVVGDQFSTQVIRVDPATGAQTVITSQGLLQNPFGIEIDAGGRIVASDTLGGLIQIEPTTGTQTAIPNSVAHFTRSVVVAPGGALFVAGLILPRSAGISRVDPQSGTTTRIASGGFLYDLYGIALDAAGQLIVGNGYGPGGAGAGPLIVRVDPATGFQYVVSHGGLLQDITGLCLDDSGTIVATGNVMGGAPPGLYTIDPTTGNQALLSSGGYFIEPFGVDVDSGGDYVVSDRGSDAVYRVARSTGAQTLISQGGHFTGPCSVRVVDGTRTLLPGDLIVGDPGSNLVIHVDPATATTPHPIQTLDTAAGPSATRRYQFWFRTPTGPCGSMANLTNGYEIAWGT